MRGVILVNTGSPASLDPKDVGWFIGEMLSDPLLLTVPDWMRNILARKIIAPLRSSRSASRYSLIWNKEHNLSPLIYHTHQLAKKIETETELPVEVAMRYGEPSISAALKRISDRCSTLHEVVVIPMFPQYAQSSYQTVVDEVGRCFYKNTYPFRLKILEPFFDNQAYIEALAHSLRPYVEKPYDRLVFSFHSLPLSHEKISREKGKQFDYVYQLKETIKLVSKELGVDPKKNRVVYSSAMGRKWLEPSLTATMKTLAQEDCKNIIIITPGFPADNLETLFDVDIEARKIFMKYGGKEFHFVSGLNSEDHWVTGVVKMLTRKV